MYIILRKDNRFPDNGSKTGRDWETLSEFTLSADWSMERTMLSFVEFLQLLNSPTRRFYGLTITPTGFLTPRLLWGWIVFNALMSVHQIGMLWTDDVNILAQYGDYSFLIADRDRDMFAPVNIFYCISSSLLLYSFTRLDFSKFGQIEKMPNRFNSDELSARIRKTAHYLVLVKSFFSWFRSIQMVGAMFMTLYIYDYRRKLFMYFSCAYFSIYAVTTSTIISEFTFEMYYISQIGQYVFHSINTKLVGELRSQPNEFPSEYFSNFNDGCLLINWLSTYIRPLFVVYFSCNLVVCIFLQYSAIYSTTIFAMKFIYVLFFCAELVLMVFFSWCIGKIDDVIKHPVDVLYRHFVIRNTPLRRKTYHKYQFSFYNYFQAGWRPSTLGLSVMGYSINSETSIKVITVFLTIFALLSGTNKRLSTAVD